jgi:methyl-accepting chemotaxis protein
MEKVVLETIRSKVKFAGLMLVILCATGSGSGLLIAATLGQSMAGSARMAQVMRNHMEADMMHDALRSDVLAAMLAASDGRPGAMTRIRADLEEHSTTFTAAIRRNDALATNPRTVRDLKAAEEPLRAYIASAQRIVSLAADDPAAARAELTAFGARFSELETRMATLADEIETTLQTTARRAELIAAGGVIFMLVIIFLSIGLSLVLARLSIRSIVKPIGVLNDEMAALSEGRTDVELTTARRVDELGAVGRSVEALQALIIARAGAEAEAQQALIIAKGRAEAEAQAAAAARRDLAEQAERAKAEEQAAVVTVMAEGMDNLRRGDLTHRITRDFPAGYETLKDDFNAAVARLEETMVSVDGNASAIRRGAHEMTSASDDLSRRTEQQAASLEETAAALEQLTATVAQAAEGARKASELVGAARDDAAASGRVVGEAVQAMDEIQASSKEISQIIGVIDEIAFQTNLLALNAGVEAARAGDAGRGFAVVASEVRALAQRSAEAAREINELISKSGRQVLLGVDQVRLAGENLKRISGRVVNVGDLITEMASASEEQATALREINTAIGHMDQVTQQNAAMVEQTTAATHTLAEETEVLSQSVGRFRLSGSAPVAAGEVRRRAA